jgi:hypothetical protein
MGNDGRQCPLSGKSRRFLMARTDSAYDKLQAAMDNQSWVYLTPRECQLLMADLARAGAHQPVADGVVRDLAEGNSIVMEPVK